MRGKRSIALVVALIIMINFMPINKVYASNEANLKVGVYNRDQVMYQSVEVAFSQGDTPYSVLKRVVSNIKSTGSGDSLYVSAINGVSEFDGGPLSGWVYAVNGIKPDIGAGAYHLKTGDKLVWHYTLNLGEDIHKGISKLDNYIASNPPTTPTPEKPKPPVEEKPVVNPLPTPEVNGEKNSDDKPSNNKEPEKTEENKNTEEKKENIAPPLSKEELERSIEEILSAAKESYGRNVNSIWGAIALTKLKGEVNKEYIESIIDKVKENKGIYRKITDLEKNMLLLNMLGYDVTNIEGIDLLEILLTSDIEKQGSNGVIFALICLNSIDEKIVDKVLKENEKKDGTLTKEILVEKLLSYQHDNGGFSLSKDGEVDVDITAMALQGLGSLNKHMMDLPNVEESKSKAIEYLKNVKFENSESIAQTVIACSYVDENPQEFGGINLLEELLKYKQEDNTFKHVMNSDDFHDGMSTEQGVLAILSYKNSMENQEHIYAGKINNHQEKVDTEIVKDKNRIVPIVIGAIVLIGLIAGVLSYKKFKNNKGDE